MSNLALEELQVKVAFLEDSLSKLSDEFFIQQRELETLKVQYVGLINKVRHLQGTESGDSEILDERPPHY